MQQEKEQFGWAAVAARGGKHHVTRITGTWYGALEASAICGTRPAAQYSQHHGWLDLSKHETLQQAAAAAGHLLCSRCLKKAAQLQARADKLAAELQALEEETAAEAALDAEALAEPADYLQQHAATEALPTSAEEQHFTYTVSAVVTASADGTPVKVEIHNSGSMGAAIARHIAVEALAGWQGSFSTNYTLRHTGTESSYLQASRLDIITFTVEDFR